MATHSCCVPIQWLRWCTSVWALLDPLQFESRGSGGSSLNDYHGRWIHIHLSSCQFLPVHTLVWLRTHYPTAQCIQLFITILNTPLYIHLLCHCLCSLASLLCSLATAQVVHVSQGFTGLGGFYVLQFESRGSHPSGTGDSVQHHNQVPHGEMNMNSPYLLPLSLLLSPSVCYPVLVLRIRNCFSEIVLISQLVEGNLPGEGSWQDVVIFSLHEVG